MGRKGTKPTTKAFIQYICIPTRPAPVLAQSASIEFQWGVDSQWSPYHHRHVITIAPDHIGIHSFTLLISFWCSCTDTLVNYGMGGFASLYKDRSSALLYMTGPAPPRPPSHVRRDMPQIKYPLIEFLEQRNWVHYIQLCSTNQLMTYRCPTVCPSVWRWWSLVTANMCKLEWTFIPLNLHTPHIRTIHIDPPVRATNWNPSVCPSVAVTVWVP